MSNEKQRIAIAEACGIGPYECYDSTKDGLYGSDVGRIGRTKIPDYLNDLNACHEMEQVLILQGLAADYWRELHKPRYITWGWHATAKQRCEAFLRTIGGWEE